MRVVMYLICFMLLPIVAEAQQQQQQRQTPSQLAINVTMELAQLAQFAEQKMQEIEALRAQIASMHDEIAKLRKPVEPSTTPETAPPTDPVFVPPVHHHYPVPAPKVN